MPRAKKVVVEEVLTEAPVVMGGGEVFASSISVEDLVEKSVPSVESAEKAAFRKLIEDYGKANPVKFAGKKEALFAQLDAME
jgi:hypothetical protein